MCRRFKIFSGLLFALVFSFFFSSSSYAVDDIVLDINQSNYTDYINTSSYVCGSNSGVSCSGYKYFIVDPIDVSSLSENSRFQARFLPGGQFVSYSLPLFSRMVISLNDSFSSLSLANSQGLYEKTFSFRITLTDTLPSDCPVCEECQECPAVSENPYDEKLDNITQAIYVCAAVVLVVYFFYCIYRMLIKNSGVK